MTISDQSFKPAVALTKVSRVALAPRVSWSSGSVVADVASNSASAQDDEMFRQMVQVERFDVGHRLPRREAGHIGHRLPASSRGGRIGVRVRCAEVWEPREEVSVRPEPVGRDLAL